MFQAFPQGPLLLPRPIWTAMLSHLRAAYPQEGCGLLAGRAGQPVKWYPCANAHPAPLVAYEVAPADLLSVLRDLDDHGWHLLAICHSHPDAPAYPSRVDVARAYYPDSLYLIWSLAAPGPPAVRGFWIRDGEVTEHPLQLE